jgi:diguanylate cyclase (GGDEF)-like protein
VQPPAGAPRHRRRTDEIRPADRRTGRTRSTTTRRDRSPDAVRRPPPGSTPVPAAQTPDAALEAGSTALRRIAAEISGSNDIQALFDEVVSDATSLFAADRIGMWRFDPVLTNPFVPVAQRDVPDEIVEWAKSIRKDDREAIGLRAVVEQDVIVTHTAEMPRSRLRTRYRRHRIDTICFVPVVFRGESLGLLVLYHAAPYDWTPDRIALAQSLGDGLAAAVGNARLLTSVHDLAARLRAVQDLGLRLNRIQDAGGIGRAIVAEIGGLIAHDTIRVYRVDHEIGWCEPIAFRGTFMGTDSPTPEMLRVKIGTGLTGWVAEHNETLTVGDAGSDKRSLQVGINTGPESLLIVPMAFEDRVRGVLVVSRLGKDLFTADDEATLSIIAGAAAQALVSADRLDALHAKQTELEHQLVSQRRLLEVNERLLSTLDPAGVLELIADSLKVVVAYDSLTIYRVDLPRGVRTPVIARDRFAELILEYEAPLGTGVTGWAVDHKEPVLANDAHLDPRSTQIPGTPFEAESLIVVPLIVEGEVLGTMNIGRMGEQEAHFSQNEFELTKLFSAQASIALRNAETHGEVKSQAERDALTGLRNHGSFQNDLGATLENGDAGSLAVLMMDLDRFKAFNDTNGHPSGDLLLADIAAALAGAVRGEDRVYRYGGDEFAVVLKDAGRLAAEEVAERIRRAVDAVPSPGPRVTISIGIACYPEDGATKDAVVEAADREMYIAKGARLSPGATRDPYVAALDETAVALLEGNEPIELLRTIVSRATHLLGTPHGYVYLVDPAKQDLVVRVGTGIFFDYLGRRMPFDRGVGGAVYRSGRPVAVDDYDTFEERDPTMPRSQFGAVVGVPLTSGTTVIGVLGLAAGEPERVFGDREIGALNRFAQLASIALENARLHEAAERGALVDPVTNLPNREALMEQLGEALTWARPEDPEPMAVILLDVDRFKVVNESLGHAAGDRLLQAIGQRLLGAVRNEDVVARFGGDMFAILLPRPADRDDARNVAERVLGELKAPFDVQGRIWFISASMGIAIGEPGRTTPGDAMREAELALVRAKGDAMQRYAVYEASMSRDTLERVDLENDLRAALEANELGVMYQPIVELSTETIVAFEALARWRHPVRGYVPPSAFIPVAEETRLIVPLGRVVLDTACEQAVAWHKAWPNIPLRMSVNLSPRQFAQPDLVARIDETLKRTGMTPSALELEITEGIAMDQSETGLRALRQLRDRGVRIVLDDFGTGYSSLSYLRNLPIDLVKIDRSFVADLERVDANTAIVQAVVSLAHGLGFEVVAEGIETPAQAARLRSLGVDLGQGFNWSPAVPADKAEAFLRRGGNGRARRNNHAVVRKRPIVLEGGAARRVSGGRRAAGAGTRTG